MTLKKSALKSMNKAVTTSAKSKPVEERNNIAASLFEQPPVVQSTSKDEFTVYIDVKDIIPNPLNQEEISDIEEMKSSIETAGEVMHNLVVKEKNESGKYMLIAGERRWTAVKQLVAEGKEQYRMLPCHIQDMGALGEDALKMPEEWRERFLLETSNVEQRRDKSLGETMRRVERVEQLYKEMKEAGVKPPGKIRDLTAKALGMDSRTIGNYKNLSSKATDELKNAIDSEDISYRGAMELAQNPPEDQNKILAKAKEIQQEKIKNASDEKERSEAQKPLSEKDIEEATIDTFKNVPEVEDSDRSDEEGISTKSQPELPKKRRTAVIPDDEIEKAVSVISDMMKKCENLHGKEFPQSVYKTIQKNMKVVVDGANTIVNIIGER